MNRIEQQFANIQNAHLQSITLSVWSIDDSLIQTQLMGLRQLPDIEFVEINIDNTMIWAAGERSSRSTLQHQYTLTPPGSPDQHLGVLTVIASIDNVYNRLIDRAGIILVSNGIKTFLVSGFIIWLIWLKVTQNLNAISSYIDQLDFKANNNRLVLPKTKHKLPSNEFDYLADSINTSQDRLKDLLQERNALTDSLKQHKEHLEDKVAERTEELARYKDTLLKSQAQLISILEASPIGVGVSDYKSGKITFSNSRCAEIFGFNNTDWMHHNPSKHWAYKSDKINFFRTFRAQGKVEPREVELVRKDGTRFWTLLSWDPIKFNEQDQILFWVMDINVRKHAEMALKHAKDEAVQATHYKSEFLAMMSHEIRTPMNAVIGFCHLALQTQLTQQQSDYLSKIKIASHNLLRVINDILDFSKIEAGKLVLERTSFNLDDVLEQLCDLLRLRAEEKGLEILLFHSWDLPRHFIGDPLRLSQILTNLTTNAIKFTEQGEISINVDERYRTRDSIQLEFKVTDSGIGMTPEEVDKLFKPFNQANISTARRFGGSGLGLVICKQLVEMMDGQIGVTSEKGKGTTFTFSCTLQIDQQLSDINYYADPIKGKRVLIVDDSKASRDMLSSLSCNFGMYTYSVNSGEEAVEELARNYRSDEPNYDLLLLDWQMPHMNGLECAEKIKNMGHVSPLPAIVMVTAHDREDVVKNATKVNVDGFLLKPVSPSILLSSIKNALRLKDQATDAPARIDVGSGKQAKLDLRVLLVEDNPINQQVATELLEGFGCTVLTANHGQEAIDTLNNSTVDIVLMDIQMPVMDGIEATKQLRLDERYSELPIVAMTANALSEDYDRSINAGMNDHITKPIIPNELLATLSKWTGGLLVESIQTDEKTTTSNTEALTIRHVNVDSGLLNVNSNKSLFVKLLNEYCTSYSNASEQLEHLVNDGKWDQVKRLSHTIAGASGNLGIQNLYRQFALIEKASSTHDIKQIHHELNNISQQFIEIQEDLSQLQVSTTQSDTTTTVHNLKQTLSVLIDLLEDGDSRSAELLPIVHTSLQDKFSTELDQLEQLILDYEFDEALELITTQITPSLNMSE